MNSIPLTNACGVYRITCVPTGRFYIGSSVVLRQRILEHIRLLNKAKHHNPYLQKAWSKYGQDAFVFAIEETCDREHLTEREQFYLDTLHPFEPAHFNISRDARNPSRNMSPEYLERFAIAQRNRPPTKQETRDRIRAAASDPMAREHNAAYHRGRKASAETKRKMSAWQKQRPPYSAETLKRKSEATKRAYARMRAERDKDPE